MVIVMKKVLIVISSLVVSLLAMIPINNSYSKDVNPWMSKVSGDTRIIDMSIPGTHDSGATHSLFDVAGKLKVGTNTIVIKTYDSPAYADRKENNHIGYGAAFPLRPHGFTGDIKIG